MEEEKTENRPKNSILKTFLICLVLIPSITAIWVINTSPVFNNEVKNFEINNPNVRDSFEYPSLKLLKTKQL